MGSISYHNNGWRPTLKENDTMKQLMISEMSIAQMREVFEHNEGLQNDVYDDAIESEMYYVREILETLRPSLRDWSVGPGARSNLRVNSAQPFITAVVEVQESYAILTDENATFLYKAEKAVEKLYTTDSNSEEYDVLDEIVDGYAEVLSRLVEKSFDEALSGITFEACKGYFLDFYVDARLDGDEYVELREDGTTDWRLKKSVIKTF